jgi:uncharacterized damage-inducible protein DinB
MPGNIDGSGGVVMTTLLLTAILVIAPAPDQAAAPAANQTIGSVRGMTDMVKGYLTKAAAQVPEDQYAFKPTPEVRSMGEVFAHVADANFGICGMVGGDKPPMSGIEKTKKTKAEITEALAASFAFCEKVFDSMTDARANEVVPKFFVPGTHTRLGVLAFNAAHDFEHYGNIVTYMRLKGMVPPSSARGM